MTDETDVEKGRGPHQPAAAQPPSIEERSPMALAGLGIQFFAGLIFFVFVGAWADRKLDTSPLFLLLGVFIGGGGTFYMSYRQLTAPPSSRNRKRPE